MYKFMLLMIIFFLCVILYLCKSKDAVTGITNITQSCVCVNDGMLLLEYDGPKAQIVWRDGKSSFFCEPREAFYEIHNPAVKNRIKHFLVQDFSGIPWGSYTDRWVNAYTAFFVINSSKNGAMGVSFVPFSNECSANAFKMIYGGKVILFSLITPQELLKSNELLKKRLLEDL